MADKTNPIILERQVKGGWPGGGTMTKHMYWCPGCDKLHGIAVRPSRQANGAGWTWNGSMDKPTYEPSQLTTYGDGGKAGLAKYVCHTFIRDGYIQFLDDCTHALKGTTVNLPPLPDWVVGEGKDVDA